ncbi:MAG: ABC transporter permease [Chitinophagaceae bacterium]|nr:MAG: ABC transporter permease [Chitinophagaceae bacterium]
MQHPSFRNIKPLIRNNNSRFSRLFSFLGLGMGVILLLCSVQMFLNIQELLGNKTPRKNNYDFISISKTITNETMGNLDKNLFQEEEISEVKAQSFIDGVGPLIANRFRTQLSIDRIIPFSTDFFVEALDASFIDTVPPTFQWQPGQDLVPVILSSDFMEIYNVFAPGYGLPQVSEATASQLIVNINCFGENGRTQTFRATIVAYSDRINSVLVPAEFLNWANKEFGNVSDVKATRLFLRTKDANDPALLNFLDSKNYKVNKDKTKFGRVKQVLQGIFTGLGFFGFLVVMLALMLFSFYLQLMIARSKENLQLLLTLGYSPGWLSKKVTGLFVPAYVVIVACALLTTQILHWLFHHFVLADRPELSPWIHWIVWLVAAVLTLLSIVINYRMIKRLLLKMY